MGKQDAVFDFIAHTVYLVIISFYLVVQFLMLAWLVSFFNLISSKNMIQYYLIFKVL